MSNDRRSADVDLEIVTSALEDGLNSCRSVVKSYRAMLEQRMDAEQVDAMDGGAWGLGEINRTNDGTGSGVDKS